MKTLVRNIAIYSFALYVLPQFIPGVELNSGLLTLFIGGTGLALMFLILKPILNIISLPVNVLSLGIFSIFTNALILYLFTVLFTDISITAFTYPKTDFLGVIIPSIVFNTFFAYVYTAFVLATIDSFLRWLME